jgi:hypothetical protein
MIEPGKKTLEGDKAIDLWLQGKDAWNKWVENNPIADVSFRGVDFSQHRVDDNISFYEFKFPTGNVDFFGASFGEGDVDFHKANFGNGDVNFFNTVFGAGPVSFSDASFGDGDVSFHNAIFSGNVFFNNLQHCNKVKLFSFRNVSFAKSFTIAGDFGCVVDMVGTKTIHHVELSGLKCQLRRNDFCWISTDAIDNHDAVRLRRLKVLAEQNKHHEAALRFHADEMRAERWHKTKGPAACLDVLFDILSNYGQSIWRPVVGLGALIILSPFAAEVLAKAGEIIVSWGIDKAALKTAIQNSLPFLPASRSTSSLLSTLHQLGAFVFIFLIGLGLRNRFRV